MAIARWKILDGKTMEVLREGEAHNEIKNLGLAEISKLIGAGLTATQFSALALGTDNTANDPTQTTLIAEITTGGCGRGAATVTNETTNIAGDTTRFVKQWTLTLPFTINEMGIFNNNSAGGVMLGRLLIGPDSLVATNILQAQYDIVISRP